MDKREFEIKKRRIQHGYAIKACDLELEELKEIQGLEGQLETGREFKLRYEDIVRAGLGKREGSLHDKEPITNTVNFRGVQIGESVQVSTVEEREDEVIEGDQTSQDDLTEKVKAETPMAGPYIDTETPMMGPHIDTETSVKVSVDSQARSEEEKDVDILDVNEMTMLEEILNRLSYVEYIKPLNEKNYEIGLTDTNENSITVQCELPDFEPAPDGRLVNVCPYPHVKTNRAELGVTYTREYFKEPKPEVDEVFPDLDNPKFVDEERKYPTHDDFARILKTDSEIISVKEVFDYLGEITDFPEDDLKRIQEELGR